ncbi:DUF2252 domain-containing protein [Streptacidiphilus neutrinimicus]|uniref:DUF2252 domain-containing protein n=1 Tax=Streptacidiphilus neutrinimicus TaxID=105420 RepID=UPI000A0768FC|nr:DUF2252 domain-containing protein [Streptacidiphilus neutrinimicus]
MSAAPDRRAAAAARKRSVPAKKTAAAKKAAPAKRAAPAKPSAAAEPRPPRLTPAQRAELGERARAKVPLAEHEQFGAGPGREDPVAILERQAQSRVPELVPVRYGRMLVSPFTFYRGAAAVMAEDLAGTPVSGLTAQLCGDAHLSNFGLFASPERRLMFDVNDFDETYPGPWEWDVKRLAASLEIAARENSFSRKERRKIVTAAVRGYQKAMAGFAGMRNLDVWYASADVEEVRSLLASHLNKTRKAMLKEGVAKAQAHDSLRAFRKLTETVDGQRRIIADPPLIVPVADLLPGDLQSTFHAVMQSLLARYRSTLQSDRRVLMESFELVDMARKVVGVGSVGTRCWIALFTGRDSDDPLFLQIKEAQRSVLEDVVQGGPSFANEGERVVHGQRLMQAASDIFLGWESAEGIDGQRRDFYIRQLADWKGSVDIEQLVPTGLAMYGRLCGWTLARAHARSGDSIAIAAYLGDDKTFAQAVAEFSALYADQNEIDFAALQQADRENRITVELGL